MKKVLYIDLHHLAWRAAFAYQNLSYDGKPIGLIYGCLYLLGRYRKEYPLHHTVCCLDAGYKRRERESNAAVKEGIIPESYKENRKKDKDDHYAEMRDDVERQMAILRKVLEWTVIQQVKVPGFEADDVIASYVLNSQFPSVIITSDRDYFQLLEEGVVVDDQLHNRLWDLDSFRDEFGLRAPSQWIDCGALSGDSSDNIFGVPGIGEKWAVKFIKEHGSWRKVVDYFKAMPEALRPKKGQAIVEYEKRIELAFSLKKMDDDVCVPPLQPHPSNREELEKYFRSVEFTSLKDSLNFLT